LVTPRFRISYEVAAESEDVTSLQEDMAGLAIADSASSSRFNMALGPNLAKASTELGNMSSGGSLLSSLAEDVQRLNVSLEVVVPPAAEAVAVAPEPLESVDEAATETEGTEDEDSGMQTAILAAFFGTAVALIASLTIYFTCFFRSSTRKVLPDEPRYGKAVPSTEHAGSKVNSELQRPWDEEQGQPKLELPKVKVKVSDSSPVDVPLIAIDYWSQKDEAMTRPEPLRQAAQEDLVPQGARMMKGESQEEHWKEARGRQAEKNNTEETVDRKDWETKAGATGAQKDLSQQEAKRQRSEPVKPKIRQVAAPSRRVVVKVKASPEGVRNPTPESEASALQVVRKVTPESRAQVVVRKAKPESTAAVVVRTATPESTSQVVTRKSAPEPLEVSSVATPVVVRAITPTSRKERQKDSELDAAQRCGPKITAKPVVRPANHQTPIVSRKSSESPGVKLSDATRPMGMSTVKIRPAVPHDSPPRLRIQQAPRTKTLSPDLELIMGA